MRECINNRKMAELFSRYPKQTYHKQCNSRQKKDFLYILNQNIAIKLSINCLDKKTKTKKTQ